VVSCLRRGVPSIGHGLNYTEDEIAEMLSKYSPWVRNKARQFPSFPEDDLVQEALLAMWKELVKYKMGSKIPIDFIMKRRATWRMLDIVSGRPWTSYKNYKRHAGLRLTTVPLDADECAIGSLEIDDCYLYRQEVRDVLASTFSIEQRKYVVLKYMYDFKNPELKELAGSKPHAIEKKLRTSMAHLKDLVH
jgi:hypothetical protein